MEVVTIQSPVGDEIARYVGPALLNRETFKNRHIPYSRVTLHPWQAIIMHVRPDSTRRMSMYLLLPSFTQPHQKNSSNFSTLYFAFFVPLAASKE